MAYKKIEELSGEEQLERAILSSDYQTILPAGARLKKEYISRLIDLGIEGVYIKEENSLTEEMMILKTDVQHTVKGKVKNILEHHTYRHNEELMELCNTADNIISNIASEQQVMEKVYDIKQRSADIYEHSLNMCTLSVITALKLKLPAESIHDIGVACLLHDIGLRYLTINYENQDLNELSEADMVEFKKHPVYGYSALKKETWISEMSKNIILYHHERLDGSGYPLHARLIPMEIGIVNVCDTFDELICGIGSKKIKVNEAVDYLKKSRDTKFDGKIIDTFLEFTAVYPAGTKVVTNQREVAIVIRQNKGFPDRPVLRIVVDKIGNNITTDMIKDLTESGDIFIERVLD